MKMVLSVLIIVLLSFCKPSSSSSVFTSRQQLLDYYNRLWTPYDIKTFEPIPSNRQIYEFTSGGYDFSVTSSTSYLAVCPGGVIRTTLNDYLTITFTHPIYPTSFGMDLFNTFTDCQTSNDIGIYISINEALPIPVSRSTGFFGWAGDDAISTIVIFLHDASAPATPGMTNLLLATPSTVDYVTTTSALNSATSSSLDHATTSSLNSATTSMTGFVTSLTASGLDIATTAAFSSTFNAAATSAFHSATTASTSTTGPPSPPSFTCTYKNLLGYRYNISALNTQLYAYEYPVIYAFNPCGVSPTCGAGADKQSCVVQSHPYALASVNQQTIIPPETSDGIGSTTINYLGGSLDDGCFSGRSTTVLLICKADARDAIVGRFVEDPSCHYTVTVTSMYACPVSGPDIFTSFQSATSTLAHSTSTLASQTTSMNSIITSINAMTTASAAAATTNQAAAVTSPSAMSTTQNAMMMLSTSSLSSSLSSSSRSATTMAASTTAIATTSGPPSPPSITCRFRSPLGYSYDLSPLDLELQFNSLHTFSPQSIYYFNPCGEDTKCGSNVQSCEVSNNNDVYIIGYIANQTIIPSPSYYGTTTIMYGGGPSVAGCDGRSATINLVCDPKVYDPIITQAVESPLCRYTFGLSSKHACPNSPPPPPVDSTVSSGTGSPSVPAGEEGVNKGLAIGLGVSALLVIVAGMIVFVLYRRSKQQDKPIRYSPLSIFCDVEAGANSLKSDSL